MLPRPIEQDLTDFYPEDYQAYRPESLGLFRNLAEIRQRQKLRDYRKRLGLGRLRLFDVGTGDGRHASILSKLDKNIHFSGVELNSKMAQAARDSGWSVENGTIESLDMSNRHCSADILTMNHVLEHVVAPRVVLSRSYELLRPGGWIFGEMPVIDCWERILFGRLWGGYHFPRHLQIPTRFGLSTILQDVGFDNIRIRTTPQIQSAVSLQNLVMNALGTTARAAGKTAFFPLLALFALPFEVIVWIANRGAIVRFEAQRPLSVSTKS